MSTKGIQKLGDLLAKNSPTILTGLGVAGLVTTTIMAVKATPKAIQILDDERYCRKLDNPTGVPRLITKKEVIKLTWKCYIPTAIMGTLTIGCIVSANSISLKRNAALAGLYSLSETALKEYQAKVVETIGQTKERAIKDDLAKDKIIKNPVSAKEVVVTGKGDTLCYDALSGRYFKSDIEHIRKVLSDMNYDLFTDMFITLNELYYALDLKGTKLGDLVGWHVDDGKVEPDFSSQLAEDGTPCLVLDFSVEPRYNYND